MIVTSSYSAFILLGYDVAAIVQIIVKIKGAKMKDPVCNMDVKSNSEFRSTYNGRLYLFCSASCKKSFDKRPEAYVKN